MRKTATLVAGVSAAAVLTLSPASPASAGNAVSQPEFWTNLSGMSRSNFEANVCNCDPIQVTYLNPEHDALVAVYDAGVGYSRNVIQIVIRFDWTDGAYRAHNFPNNGGKEQVWKDSSGQHTSFYPVAATHA